MNATVNDESGALARRARLDRARREGLLVAVRRRTPDTSPIKGFVIGLGRRWVALAALDDRIRLAGWSLVRLREILAVGIDPDPDCFEIRALKARSQWPVPVRDFSLDNFVGAVTSSIGATDVGGVELGAPTDRYFIGSVASVTRDELRLKDINAKGAWRRKVRSVAAADIVRLDVGDPHVEAFRVLAGPLPPALGGDAAGHKRPGAKKESVKGRTSAVEGDTVLERLERAHQAGALVTLRRKIPEADTVTGVIVGIGEQWLAVARIGSAFAWDGWTMLRIGEISDCRNRESDPWGRIVTAVHDKTGTSAPPQLDVDLDGITRLAETARAGFPLVTIFSEYLEPDACWIGSAEVVDPQTVSMRTLDTRAHWNCAPRLFDADDITLIDVGDDYEGALWLAAGTTTSPGAAHDAVV